jgi:hypothetical protein
MVCLETPASISLRRIRWGVVFILVLASVLAILRVALLRFLDDAYITFLYARNLAEGKGFIFSERYPTWGTTTPLLTILLALSGIVGADIPTVAAVLDGVALGMQGIFGCLIFRTLRLNRWWPLATLAIMGLISLPTSFPGMEYGLYAACSVGALACIASSNWSMAALLAAMSATLRPDGALVWLLIFCAYLVHTRGRIRPVTFFACLTVLPTLWYLYALIHFGTLLPQTLATRQIEAGGWGKFGSYFAELFLHPERLRPILLSALLGLVLSSWRAPRMLWFAIYSIIYILLYTLFGLPGLMFYLCPIHLIIIIFTCAWVALSLEELLRRRRIVFIVLLLACVFICTRIDLKNSSAFWGSYLTTRWQRNKLSIYRGVALWLRHDFPPGTVFATNEIGVLGYYSRQDLVEIGGLVNPEGYRYMKGFRFGELIHSINAPILVLPVRFIDINWMVRGKRVLDSYNLLAVLEGDDGEGVWVLSRKDFLDTRTLKQRRLELFYIMKSYTSLSGSAKNIGQPACLMNPMN